ncbi:hypothetical protein CsatB_023298 [Cannabis sativa]|uniref:uncharacterized protein LOC115713277 n=1 Tax=Cannabis sativa TaxID=3483 RepID=UPI0011E01271|nr:uncharacterized protein LOC115713277 [Cannabis sativa]
MLWWCILSKAIPVRAILAKRLTIEDVSCPLCGGSEETLEHLFLTCNWASHLWRAFPWGISPNPNPGNRLWDWVKFIWRLDKMGINSDEVFLYASIVIDTIWRTRNDKVHNKKVSNISQCVDYISNSYADYRASLLPAPSPSEVICWKPPPHGWIKLNCDVKVGLDSMYAAVVARNHLGVVERIQSSSLAFCDALCGEATACCLALEVAKEAGWKFIIIESDSRVVINSINGLDVCWGIENYSNFCLRLSRLFDGCNFSFVSRCCNFMAHNVAKWTFTNYRFGRLSDSSFPNNILCNDREV